MAKAKIIIIDDDVGACESLSDIFEEIGYSVSTANTGSEAVSMAGKTAFDIAFIDIKLPDMDGLEILKELKTGNPEIDCMIITGHASQQNAISALKKGANDYFVKPLDINEITRRVKETLDRKFLRRELRNSEERLRAIIDNSTAIIYVRDLNGRYILINRWFEKLFHVDREEIKGKTDHDIFLKETADEFRANDLKVIEASAPIEFEETAIQEDGLHTYISIKFPLLDADGKPYAVCGISTDITGRKQAEEKLRVSEEMFKAIFENASDGILLADPEEKIFFLGNKSICKMLGYSKDEIGSLGVMDIHPKEDLPNILEQFEKQLRGEITMSENLPVKRRDGTVFHADISASTITLGDKTYMIGIFRDTIGSSKL
ncbi:MAG: PAS domain S-box protein [Thermodesulfobacteriota bacterium]